VFEVVLESSLKNCVNHFESFVPLEKMLTDLIVTIGGDGTILRTCLRIPKSDTPLLTIDMGVRGFLTEVSPNMSLEAVKKYLEGAYFIENYGKIASYVGKTRLPDALNEVFLTSRRLAKLLHLRILKGDVEVAKCRADGVIIATQVGSTGYSFSSGGPILDPNLGAFVLTPVCPLTFFQPIVFPLNSFIQLQFLKPKGATIVVDGDFQREIKEKSQSIFIKNSEYQSSFIRFENNFYKRLRARMLFSREEAYENE
jgi:NAD+ kinase